MAVTGEMEVRGLSDGRSLRKSQHWYQQRLPAYTPPCSARLFLTLPAFFAQDGRSLSWFPSPSRMREDEIKRVYLRAEVKKKTPNFNDGKLDTPQNRDPRRHHSMAP